jgi:chromosome segregation ATPase
VEEFITILEARIKKLQKREDEFNRNAALVPESDPDVALINDRIQEMKERVEKASADKTTLLVEFKRVNDRRINSLLEFVDSVNQHLQPAYAALTGVGAGGQALLMVDKANPYERNVLIQILPPGKRVNADIR